MHQPCNHSHLRPGWLLLDSHTIPYLLATDLGARSYDDARAVLVQEAARVGVIRFHHPFLSDPRPTWTPEFEPTPGPHDGLRQRVGERPLDLSASRRAVVMVYAAGEDDRSTPVGLVLSHRTHRIRPRPFVPCSPRAREQAVFSEIAETVAHGLNTLGVSARVRFCHLVGMCAERELTSQGVVIIAVAAHNLAHFFTNDEGAAGYEQPVVLRRPEILGVRDRVILYNFEHVPTQADFDEVSRDFSRRLRIERVTIRGSRRLRTSSIPKLANQLVLRATRRRCSLGPRRRNAIAHSIASRCSTRGHSKSTEPGGSGITRPPTLMLCDNSASLRGTCHSGRALCSTTR